MRECSSSSECKRVGYIELKKKAGREKDKDVLENINLGLSKSLINVFPTSL